MSTTQTLDGARKMSIAGEGAARRAKMEIDIEQHFESRIYNPGSKVTGHVAISGLRQDVAFAQLDIALVGTSYVRNDFISGGGGGTAAAVAARPFLKLQMPPAGNGHDGNLPASSTSTSTSTAHPRVLREGHMYSIPFHFVIPHQLPLHSCSHGCPQLLKNHHLALPPTLGHWEDDDQSPTTTKIRYFISVSLLKEDSDSSNIQTHERGQRGPPPPAPLLKAERTIKVLPLLPEAAPLAIEPERDERYRLSRTKPLRGGGGFLASLAAPLAKPAPGRLTVSAAQPRAVAVGRDAHIVSETEVLVRLEAEIDNINDNKSKKQQPGIAGLENLLPSALRAATAKIETETHSSLESVGAMPNLGRRATQLSNPRVSYASVHRLSMPSTKDFGGSDKLRWEEAPPSASATDAKTATTKTFTSHIRIPIPLRTVERDRKRLFLPTFHFCRISRTYTLHLSLTLGGPSSSGISSPSGISVNLAIPLQIAVEESALATTPWAGRSRNPSVDSSVQGRVSSGSSASLASLVLNAEGEDGDENEEGDGERPQQQQQQHHRPNRGREVLPAYRRV